MPEKNKIAIPAARIKWPPLIKGQLVRRYKRFLADVLLEDGSLAVAHCPNSGRMTGCCQPGRPVYISHHPEAHRKLHYTWQMIEMPASLVGVNTQIPNRLVALAVRTLQIKELTGYQAVKSEVSVMGRSRLDLKLSAPGRRDCFVEIKNCTLVQDRTALFPDAPTERGRRHLDRLQQLHAMGHRAVIFFLVQRTDAGAFGPADSIDPLYGKLLRQVVSSGVEIIAYDVVIDLEAVSLGNRLPCIL